jgi:hypothetical protein
MERRNKFLIGEAAFLFAAAGFSSAECATMPKAEIPPAIIQQIGDYDTDVSTITYKLESGEPTEAKVIFDSPKFQQEARAMEVKKNLEEPVFAQTLQNKILCVSGVIISLVSFLAMGANRIRKWDKEERDARAKRRMSY